MNCSLTAYSIVFYRFIAIYVGILLCFLCAAHIQIRKVIIIPAKITTNIGY